MLLHLRVCTHIHKQIHTHIFIYKDIVIDIGVCVCLFVSVCVWVNVIWKSMVSCFILNIIHVLYYLGTLKWINECLYTLANENKKEIPNETEN